MEEATTTDTIGEPNGGLPERSVVIYLDDTGEVQIGALYNFEVAEIVQMMKVAQEKLGLILIQRALRERNKPKLFIPGQ